MSQELTKTNQDDLITWKYANILGMKVLGFKYSVIAQKTGYSEGWIKQLFMEKGKLAPYVNKVREVSHKASLQEVVDIIIAELPDIARTMATTAKMPFDMSGVAAGKTLLEYGIGKSIDREKSGTGLGSGTIADLVDRVALRRKQNESGTRGEISDGMGEQPPVIP
jgi:hypothetical protein